VFGRCAALVALLILAGAGVPPARPEAGALQAPPASPARSPRNASYAITARLDPASRTITGSEILTWRNTTNTPAAALRGT
jgi:hypothetical protein